MINCRTHQLASNIGRTEIATLVGLYTRGCSPIHIILLMLANRMGAWSDVGFAVADPEGIQGCTGTPLLAIPSTIKEVY